MQGSLSKEFNATADAAYKAFPEQLKRLVILLAPNSDTPVYVSPEVADKLTKDTAMIKAYVAGITDYLYSKNAAGTAARGYDLAGTTVDLIALASENHKGIFNERYTEDMRAVYDLDHEIGHHILKNGTTWSTLRSDLQIGEAAADAYAMLRHIQRFGKNTDRAGAYAESRSYNLVLNGDTAHYTTDVVNKAIAYADKHDISKLSLQETAEIAEKIAEEGRFTDETLDKIRDAYLPVVEASRKKLGDAFHVMLGFYDGDNKTHDFLARQVLDVIGKHKNDADIVKTGKQFLNYPLIREFIEQSAKTDIFWRRALATIDAPAIKAVPKAAAQKSQRTFG